MGAHQHPTTTVATENEPRADGGDEERVVQDLYDGVSFRRGWGDDGKRVKIVERDCEKCHYDRMVRVCRVCPEPDIQYTKYFCQNPNCPDSHENEVENLGYIPPMR